MSVTDWLLHTPVAHRGLHGAGVAENSLAAFHAAVMAETAIELDVRVSLDGVPVVFHDDALSRLTGRHGRLDQHDLATLRTLRLCGTDEPIPSLYDVLEMVAGRTPVLIEIKRVGRAGERATAEVLAGRPGALALQSFNPSTVRRLKRLRPDLPCGLVAASAERLAVALALRPDFIAYDVRKASRRLARQTASILGIPLLVWTVRTTAERKAAAALNANVIFED